VAFDPEDMRRRRVRNWAILVVLVALCALFYAITIVKMTKS
jgi:Flp pilus assembly protein protease CpaA